MHEVWFLEYSLNVSKEKIQKEWNNKKSNEYGSCMRIDWNLKKFIKKEDAESFLESKGDYYCGAVQFFDFKKNKIEEKKHIKMYKSKITQLKQEYKELNEKEYFKDHKSVFISCKNCKSKIALKYLNKNICPICLCDLRPNSFQEKLKNKKKKIDKLNEILKKEIKKEEEIFYNKYKNNEKYWKWLVRIEYHC